jgi:hypothetical protein
MLQLPIVGSALRSVKRRIKMNGRINKNGQLYIKRSNCPTMVQQLCPYVHNDDASCGEWCPLFGEASPSKWAGSPDPNSVDRKSNSKHWNLKICRKTLFFDNFIDERN